MILGQTPLGLSEEPQVGLWVLHPDLLWEMVSVEMISVEEFNMDCSEYL